MAGFLSKKTIRFNYTQSIRNEIVEGTVSQMPYLSDVLHIILDFCKKL